MRWLGRATQVSQMPSARLRAAVGMSDCARAGRVRIVTLED